jgi:hypothetical protein
MHPVLANILRSAAKGIEDDPERFFEEVKAVARKIRRKIKSKSFERQFRNNLLRVAARRVRRAL